MRLKVVYGNPKRYFLVGPQTDREITEAEAAELFPSRFDELVESAQAPGGTATSTWPKKSIALSGTPSTAAALRERARRHGIAAEYDGDGVCTVRTREARAKLMRLEGLHDNLGGYGD